MIISLPGCDFKYCKFNSDGNCLERNKNDGCTYRRLKENVDNNWISVKDRLPEEKGQYLVAYHPCYWDMVQEDIAVGIDSFRGGKTYNKKSWARNKYQLVTHWMPLPEPPEMEGATNNEM